MQNLLRINGLKAKTQLGRSTCLSQVSDKLLPPPIRIGARAVAWVESEVDTVLRARIEGRTPHQLRELVATIVAARQGTQP